jgi:hypothetical protein
VNHQIALLVGDHQGALLVGDHQGALLVGDHQGALLVMDDQLALLIVNHHIVECLVQLVRAALDLQLLPVYLVLDIIHLKSHNALEGEYDEIANH